MCEVQLIDANRWDRTQQAFTFQAVRSLTPGPAAAETCSLCALSRQASGRRLWSRQQTARATSCCGWSMPRQGGMRLWASASLTGERPSTSTWPWCASAFQAGALPAPCQWQSAAHKVLCLHRVRPSATASAAAGVERPREAAAAHGRARSAASQPRHSQRKRLFWPGSSPAGPQPEGRGDHQGQGCEACRCSSWRLPVQAQNVGRRLPRLAATPSGRCLSSGCSLWCCQRAAADAVCCKSSRLLAGAA